jgi:hypothetical protein
MGWLLTLLLAVPQVDGPVQVEMWFSRESYCTFAAEKFTEQPMYSLTRDAGRAAVAVSQSTCRELGPEEANRVPPHMRDRLLSPEADTGF